MDNIYEELGLSREEIYELKALRDRLREAMNEGETNPDKGEVTFYVDQLGFGYETALRLCALKKAMKQITKIL